MPDSELAFDSLVGLAARLRAGSLDPVALVEQLLGRIASLDGSLHSFICLTPERALVEARAAGRALAAGQDLGPLHGLPFAVKDLFDVKGTQTTAGTRLRDGHRAEADSAAVEKLGQRGMSLLGKTHTVQFAYGAVGINHDQGTPRNPWQPTPYAPGGSSSGSGGAGGAGPGAGGPGTGTRGAGRAPPPRCVASSA